MHQPFFDAYAMIYLGYGVYLVQLILLVLGVLALRRIAKALEAIVPVLKQDGRV
jgi:hypothetical protein